MAEKFSALLDQLSEFFAQRKGLLPMLGILMVAINAILQFIPGAGWLAQTNLLLHVGVITAIVGILLAWAL